MTMFNQSVGMIPVVAASQLVSSCSGPEPKLLQTVKLNFMKQRVLYVHKVHKPNTWLERCFVTENCAMGFGEICYWESSGFIAGVRRLIVTICTRREEYGASQLSVPPPCVLGKESKLRGKNAYQIFVPKLQLLFDDFIHPS
jgi:hypothetical protein